jgi:tRNA(fMet)-specific endonuclease VapC
MNGTAGRIVLDTNILVYVIRAGPLGQSIENRFQLHDRRERPMISVVTVGEARSLAIQFGWGSDKQSRLEELLHELVLLDINDDAVLRRFAEIDAYLLGIGRSIGDNDVWIAAAASAAGATLITSDRDFEPLVDRFLRWEYVDPSSTST